MRAMGGITMTNKGFFRKDSLITLKGHLRLTARDHITGKVLAIVEWDNLVVTVGKNLVALGLVGNALWTAPDWCAIGTGATAPALSDTVLDTEANRLQISA